MRESRTTERRTLRLISACRSYRGERGNGAGGTGGDSRRNGRNEKVVQKRRTANKGKISSISWEIHCARSAFRRPVRSDVLSKIDPPIIRQANTSARRKNVNSLGRAREPTRESSRRSGSSTQRSRHYYDVSDRFGGKRALLFLTPTTHIDRFDISAEYFTARARDREREGKKREGGKWRVSILFLDRR